MPFPHRRYCSHIPLSPPSRFDFFHWLLRRFASAPCVPKIIHLLETLRDSLGQLFFFFLLHSSIEFYTRILLWEH